MQNRLELLADHIDRFSSAIGKAIAWLTFFMVVTMLIIVILRYFFDLGWIALQESVSYMHALVFMLGIGWTLQQEQHVRVDIFYQRFGKKGRAWVDLVGTLLLLTPICLFLIWSSLEYVENSWSEFEGSSEAGGLPGVFLLKSVIPLAASLLLLQGISMISRSIITLVSESNDGTD